MIQYLKLVKYFSYIYPVRNFYHQKIRKNFYHYHVKNIIKKANLNYKISPYFDLLYVFDRTPFRGLVNTLFEPDNFYFTCKDIAIAVNISVKDFSNKDDTNNEAIIDFAYHFCSEIKKRIKLDRLLSEELSHINKKIELITDNINRNEITQTLSSKKKIFEHYFKTFEDPRFNEKITIFHQNENQNWIALREEDSITIRVDLRRIREGFFIAGFDYSSENHGWLSRATSDGYYEYFNGEIKRDNIVWLN